MKYETPEAFRTALEQCLKNEAEASGTALMRLRKQMAFERFLARLAASESGGWVLEDQLALGAAPKPSHPGDENIGLGRSDHEEGATEHLIGPPRNEPRGRPQLATLPARRLLDTSSRRCHALR